MFLDYETLRLIWWGLLGFLLIGFAAMDGFDMGVGTLLTLVARTDIERRVAINTIGPVWEGNQVWFVLGGGSIFAAWPALYAVSFSGFYLAMYIILLAMILRPVAFKYRSKRPGKVWRRNWDIALTVGSAVPALMFGVAVGNVLLGVPFHFTEEMRPIFDGSFFTLLRPLALYCGLVSLLMMVMAGAGWLVVKAEGPVAERARGYGMVSALFVAALFALGGVFVSLGWFGGYEVTSAIVMDGPSNPTWKTVVFDETSWLRNYTLYPATMIAPALGVVMSLLAALAFRQRKAGVAFLCSKFSIVGIVSTVGLSMYPFILPSNTTMDHSLMVFDASSSQLTLFVMLIATVIFMPLIIGYTSWVYWVLRGKVTADDIQKNSDTVY